MLDKEAGKGEAKDGGGMGNGTVGSRLGGVGIVFAKVGEKFLAIDALELFGGKEFLMAELAAQCGSKGTAFHFPELGDGNLGGIHLEGRTHGGEKGSIGLGGTKDEVGFVFKGVNGIDDVVVGGEIEGVGSLGVVNGLDGGDMGGGVDVEEALFEDFDFDLADGGGGGNELAVDIACADAVGIDEGEVLNA